MWAIPLTCFTLMGIAIPTLMELTPDSSAYIFLFTVIICLVLSIGMTYPRFVNYMHYHEVINLANQHLSRLEDAVDPHLITWEKSNQYEKNAMRVRIITRDMVWARENLESIIEELIKHKDHTYEYIIFGNDAEAESNAETITKKVKEKKIRSHQLKIYRLNNLRGWKHFSDGWWLDIPLPTDICIYDDTFLDGGKRIARVVVNSTRLVSQQAINDPQFEYDVVYKEDKMMNHVTTWFITIRKLLEEEAQ